MKEQNQFNKGKFIYVGIVVICLLLVFAAWQTGSVNNLFNSTPNEEHIAVLNITGTISEDDGYSYNQQWLLNTIDEIIADKNNVGLLLYIDSPGGYVYQGDELYLKLLEYKRYTGCPIYVSMGSQAASGGYYVACAGDKIFANRNTITGSLGVISATHVDLSKFLGRYSIEVTEITSGKNKSMGSSYEPLTDEQKEIFQSICDEYYMQFVKVIADGRKMTEEEVIPLADGRIYSAHQALENGLIDEIATFEDTLAKMARDLDVDYDATIYYAYEAPLTFLESLMKITQPAPSAEQQIVQLLSKAQQNQFMFYYN